MELSAKGRPTEAGELAADEFEATPRSLAFIRALGSWPVLKDVLYDDFPLEFWSPEVELRRGPPEEDFEDGETE